MSITMNNESKYGKKPFVAIFVTNRPIDSALVSEQAGLQTIVINKPMRCQ